MIRKPRVAVVFGGRSSEHAISCVTAGSVLAAIDPEQYDVVPIGIARDGRWVLESGETERLRIGAGDGADRMPSVDGERATVNLAPHVSSTDLILAEASRPPRSLGEVDVVFPLLHGPWGEDGTIQGMLEMAGVRYVGAGVLASAIGMDKAYMKVVLTAAGLPVMPSVVVTAREWSTDPQACRERSAELGYPLFVKPARGGSSIGISKVHDASGLDAALEEALAHDPKVLVEVCATGAREIECGVLQALDGTTETSVPAEIRITGDHEFYDFDAKYLPEEATELDVPAVLPAEVEARLRELSARAFEAIGCEGLARVDFFVFPDGSLVVNEINTMPGFTPLSMFPRMWAASGLDYRSLVDRLIRLALARGTGLR
ncbi:D-alanine--D-alanine ligase family protein [Nocardioides marmotae]|uniref:D-alanine--D-alanine ligase n=1 Tax=Nocardioides marmotae TaxID=2663857 RepID=A0A6I3JBA0_9ACTN|nr:D-alanine--D-alanine ligase family protein [Nocardioides marmotae]MCR6031759.1 D-alanine--D-alanine ligase [Gordonia jinghuaiqii]MBC9735069.1 D-alanine--D-alanine ligase [Nocardioides marmotae]MTB86169.1 D-alanine--D-alanine ligase [Nocardioides marmotae]MTB95398.1 D-alanine--D-alanine ligase [Nocardioides marmotae]QKE00842.1 D-alanine--D-alanine ligase [Nocardioides marmotae]